MGERDGVSLHFALKPDHDPSRTATWVYISVEDADELSAEFDASGAGQGSGQVVQISGHRIAVLTLIAKCLNPILQRFYGGSQPALIFKDQTYLVRYDSD